MGGYIAASKEIIDFLRSSSSGQLYHNAMSPIITQQIITAFKVIMGLDGTNIGYNKIKALRENSNYFRSEMKRIGLHVLGDDDSPIIPTMIYIPTCISAFSRECLKRGLAVVVVGFPAVSILGPRSRFCISAGHTREDLDRAVQILDEVTGMLNLKFGKYILG